MKMLLIMVAFVGLMYLLVWLPQKRRVDAQRKAIDAIGPGARVMLNTGMFGTVRAIGNQQMVIELAPGVEVTVLRQAIMRTLGADEEEFEYSDSGTASPVETDTAQDQPAEDADLMPADSLAAADQTATGSAGELAEDANPYGRPASEDASVEEPQIEAPREAAEFNLTSGSQDPRGQAVPGDETDRPHID